MQWLAHGKSIEKTCDSKSSEYERCEMKFGSQIDEVFERVFVNLSWVEHGPAIWKVGVLEIN